jgi:hypothetical protein
MLRFSQLTIIKFGKMFYWQGKMSAKEYFAVKVRKRKKTSAKQGNCKLKRF